jgi:hypothetical protein
MNTTGSFKVKKNNIKNVKIINNTEKSLKKK